MDFGIKASYLPRPKSSDRAAATREVLQGMMERAPALAEAGPNGVTLSGGARRLTDEFVVDIAATGKGPRLRVEDRVADGRIRWMTIEENPLKRTVANLLGGIPYRTPLGVGVGRLSMDEAVSLLTKTGYDPEYGAQSFNRSLAVHNGDPFSSGDDFFSRSAQD